jgi:hypothetical protein
VPAGSTPKFLEKPFMFSRLGETMSWKITSSVPYVWARMAS